MKDCGMKDKGGWSRRHLWGNFVVTDLDFWFKPVVSKAQGTWGSHGTQHGT